MRLLTLHASLGLCLSGVVQFYAQKIEIILVTNQDPIHVWSGGLDNILKSFDINSSTESAHGSHEGAIKCVEFSGECGLVVTGSWDSTVMLLLENLDVFKSVALLLGGNISQGCSFITNINDPFQVKIWDPRAPGCQGAHSQPDKVRDNQGILL